MTPPVTNRFPHTSGTNRNGAVVTELAIISPLLVFLVMVTVSICNLIFLKQSLTVAAFEAARVAIIPGATAQDVELQAQQICQIRNVGNATVTIEPADFQNQPYGNFISVTVSAPSHQTSVDLGFLNGTSSASVSLMAEY
jgi:Flp pilus assembly protein TadG